MLTSEIEILIVKKISGNISDTELRIVDAWIVESPQNENHYRHMEAIWTASDNEQNSMIDPNREWNKLEKKIQQKSNNRYKQVLKYAAAILIPVSIAVYFFMRPMTDEKLPLAQEDEVRHSTNPPRKNLILKKSNKSLKSEYLVVRTKNNSADFFTGDSSHFYLDKNSQIIYHPFKEGSTRSVFLTGEVVLNVTPAASKFILNSKDLTIEVTGTVFGVKELKNRIELFVEEGEINAFQNGDRTNTVRIKANEVYYYDLKKEKFIKKRTKTFKLKLLKIKEKIKNFFQRRKK